MKPVLIFLTLVLSSCISEDPKAIEAAQKRGAPHPYINQRIDVLMENMDLADWGLHKLAKANDFKNPEFLSAIKILHKEMLKLPSLNHPEKRFQDFTTDSISTVKNYIDNSAADITTLKKNWLQVKNSCTACHDVYE